MARVVRLSCVAILLLLTNTTQAHTTPDIPARSPVEWMNGYTLVLVEAESKADLARARDFIVAQGGTVAVVLPPRAIFGWVSPGVASKIIGKHGIRSIHRSAVESVPRGFDDRESRRAITLFNDIVSGRSASRTLRASNRQSQSRPPMTTCSLPRPEINKDDVIRNLRLMGIEPTSGEFQAQSSVGPQYLNHSDTMDGTVAVALFLVESNGGIDPNLYTWTQTDQTAAVAQVIDGLNWWVDQSRAFRLNRPLQFTVVPYLADNPICQQPYEPVLHAGSDANNWIGHISANFGAVSSDVFARVAAINQAVREQNRADWGFSIFMAYNPPPARTSFIDGRASWAYIGGPYANILFRSFGWPLSQLVSHETGHIFFACDEYFQPGYQTCSCSCAPDVRPQAYNGNCQDLNCTRASTACMMRLNEFALCPFTVAQIGWIERLLPTSPTAPAGLVATASSPTQVNLIWQDTATTEDGFQIERRGGSSAEFSLIGVASANSTSYLDATVLPNTAYAYRVRAFNTAGQSSFSSEASAVTPSATSTLSVTTADIPEATVGVPYSRTLVASGGTPGYTWSLESGTLPSGVSLSQTGSVSGTPGVAGTNNFVVRVTDSNNNSATKALSLVVKPSAPLTITTRNLPRGSVGTTYSQVLGASGGQTPYTWAKETGNLPEGLTLNQSGSISGIPDRAGTSSFVLRITDAINASITITLSIVINPAVTVLAIETDSLDDGILGQDYAQTLRATGGNTPYRWEISQGRLPEGLRLSGEGVISGRPNAIGEYDFDVRVSDQSGQAVSRSFSIEIEPAPELTILSQSPLPLAAIGVPYRLELKASAGSAPYTWKKKKKKKFGIIPDGLVLAPEGILSGTPTTQGTYNFTIRVTDVSGKTASKSLTIEVGPPPPPLDIRTASLPNATVSLLYNASLEASGGIGPYTWLLDSGALPEGLAMTPEGVISGRPIQAGSIAFTVRVRDSIGTSTVKALFIIVFVPPPPLVIQTVQLPETSAERPYTQTLQATGGVPPYTWSLASGSLGTGLNLSADGVLSGTPESPGTLVFVVRVTDSAQQSITRTLAINIKPADKVAPFGAFETPGFGTTLNNTATGTGWALDNVGVVLVEVLVDGERVSEGVYGLPRPDLAPIWGNFPNGSRAGFSFSLDTTRLSNGEHRLAVRVLDAAGNATILGTRPVQIQNSVLTITTPNLQRGRRLDPYNMQLTATNGRPPYTWAITSGSLPQGLSMDITGRISGTPTVFGNFTVGFRVTDSVGANSSATFALTILPDVEPLRVVSSGDLTIGRTGIDYTHQLLFAGGRGPHRWSILAGALPPGLSLNLNNGLISGRPTLAGAFTFVARITDSEFNSAQSDTLTITIQQGPLGVIHTGNLPTGRTGVDYSLLLAGTGGTPPYTWSMSGGSLPPGLSLNSSTGAISGRPTQAGSFAFIVRITDSTSANAASDTLRIVIDPGPLTITSTGDLTDGRANIIYLHQLLFTGGVAPYSWSVVSGSLPNGLTLNTTTGTIQGTPTTTGTFTFVVRLADSASANTTSGPLKITISP